MQQRGGDSAASFYSQLVQLPKQDATDAVGNLPSTQDLLQAVLATGEVGSTDPQLLQQHQANSHAGAAAAEGSVSFRPVKFSQPVVLDPNTSMLTLPPKAATVTDAAGHGLISKPTRHISTHVESGSQSSRYRLQTQHTSSYTSSHSAAPSAIGASSKRPIDRSNIGFQLLQKAGWQEGKGIGAQEQGMATPLQASHNKGSLGLGFQQHKQQQQQGLVQTSSSNSKQQEQQTTAVGPVLGSKRVAALVAAELAAEDIDTKVKRHRQIMQQEVKNKRDKAITQYLYRAFNEPSDYGVADSNPLGNNHRLTATNPLLD